MTDRNQNDDGTGSNEGVESESNEQLPVIELLHKCIWRVFCFSSLVVPLVAYVLQLNLYWLWQNGLLQTNRNRFVFLTRASAFYPCDILFQTSTAFAMCSAMIFVGFAIDGLDKG